MFNQLIGKTTTGNLYKINYLVEAYKVILTILSKHLNWLSITLSTLLTLKVLEIQLFNGRQLTLYKFLTRKVINFTDF